jgi:hypothetical protein
VVFRSAVAAADPAAAREAKDEREALIALKANQAGFYALQVGVFAAATSLYWFNDTRVMANGIFLAIVLAEVVRSGLEIAAHRRGVA